jgi:hypothetical protein
MFVLNIDAGQSIFRARKHREQEKQTNLGNVENDIYPQPKYLTHLGRANRKHQPVYYFAADKGIALSEVKASQGDVITVLECKPLSVAPSLVHIGIHQMAKNYDSRIGGNYPDPETRIKELFQGDTASIIKHEMIDAFISKQFLKVVNDDTEEDLYKLTIAIAEWLFEFETDLGLVDGLAYPSLASQEINANVAFLPEAFHRLYRPVACKRVTIEEAPLPKFIKGTRIDGFTVSDERVAKAIRENGDIEW